MLNAALCESLSEQFAELPDPRSTRNRRHELGDILTLALCAMLSGADDYVAMADYGRAKRAWFAQYLNLPNGIPSHDTFRQVFMLLDRAALEACFNRWARRLRERVGQIAVDGKRQRAARSGDEAAPCSVNAYGCEHGLVLSQQSTPNKASELQGIRELIEVLDVNGCLVSLDAGGCYRDVAERLVERGGDYLLAVKANQPTLYGELDTLFAEQDETRAGVETPVRTAHGRDEQRLAWVCHEPGEVAGDWPQAACVAMVQGIRSVGDRQSAEHRFYISNRPLDAETLLHHVRSHWQVENQLHWVLDVAFNEDRSRARRAHSAANLVVLRHWAFNLLKQDTSIRLGIKNKRNKAGWDMDYLLHLLSLAQPA